MIPWTRAQILGCATVAWISAPTYGDLSYMAQPAKSNSMSPYSWIAWTLNEGWQNINDEHQ